MQALGERGVLVALTGYPRDGEIQVNECLLLEDLVQICVRGKGGK